MSPMKSLFSSAANAALPTTQSSAVNEKAHRSSASWTTPILIPIPGVQTRRLRIVVPKLSSLPVSGRKRIHLLLGIALIALVFVFYSPFSSKTNYNSAEWNIEAPWTPAGDPPTLVFRRADLQKIWQWEIASGHFPTRRSIPKDIGFTHSPENPAIPVKRRLAPPSRYRPPTGVTLSTDMEPKGAGPSRLYLALHSWPPNVAYPPRPVPNSIADMDIIMKHCDFSEGKYVRDCLEVLRVGGGLDNQQRFKRGSLDDWLYIFKEGEIMKQEEDVPAPKPVYRPSGQKIVEPDAGLEKKKGVEWEPELKLPPTHDPRSSHPPSDPCDVDNPRLFHMFWTGPFTDKPYMALLSFLFTQNTGLHLEAGVDRSVCQPQFWLWINPGPAAAVPNSDALQDMFDQLKTNPWASPFLHPRFKDVIKFKMWNTTEQLDGVPEIKEEWRTLQDNLFNSGGYIMPVHKKGSSSEEDDATETTSAESSEDEDDPENRLGSKSSSSYDRLSVILSDMARFVLCHRFGGVYLDADTIFLRDWEEIWGWKGAFGYRWSRLEKFNTAVLRMNKGSALGTFLFRTALKNGLDFHPMTVSRYIADAHLDNLLLRLPDALFDSAWLNTEWYQRDRPPHPYFTEFADFFETPAQNSAAPEALGFDGFFKGAYSYHFHNFWWKPFDPTRNYPDLGDRFANAIAAATTEKSDPVSTMGGPSEEQTADKQDLDWSAVLKRTFEAYIRGERPNMYGEWIKW